MEKATKKWEVFPGRNKFFCDGRVMMAPHTGVFCITVFLIVATSILFFVFDCPFLAVRVSPLIPAVSGLLFVFTMSALLRTSFSDPGVIPRASVEEAALYDKQIEVGTDSNSPTYRPPPRAKEVMVRGQPIKLKYCFTCKMFRPPRASHCSLCDNCVDRFDHHCPWVGNCVGRRNYRYFYMFIVSLAFLCVFMFACVVTHIVMITRDAAFLDALKDSPASVLIAVVCFFSVWSVLGLAGFHTYLASSNQTTNEDIKGSFSGKRGSEGRNPYSEGNVCSNCFHVLCGPVPPSLLDRRGLLTPEMLEEIEKRNNPDNPTQYGTVKTQPQNGGVFPPLHETCGTPNPLQQQCKGNGQANGKMAQSTPANAGSTTGSLTRLVKNEQVPGGIWHTSNMASDNMPSIDIDDVLPRSSSSITLRSLDDSQAAQEQIIMSNIDRTLHGDLRHLPASRLRLLQDTTMIESALDLDSVEEGVLRDGSSSVDMKKQQNIPDVPEEGSFSGESQVILINSPYVTPVYH